MHWYDWLIFVACWGLVPLCLLLKRLRDNRDGMDRLYSADDYLASQWHPDIPSNEAQINYEARKILINLLKEIPCTVDYCSGLGRLYPKPRGLAL